jgi:hypothetical protein
MIWIVSTALGTLHLSRSIKLSMEFMIQVTEEEPSLSERSRPQLMPQATLGGSQSPFIYTTCQNKKKTLKHSLGPIWPMDTRVGLHLTSNPPSSHDSFPPSVDSLLCHHTSLDHIPDVHTLNIWERGQRGEPLDMAWKQ